jgi:aryl-alcohol dehydrogenase-like predicted oxidoreductase
MKRRIIPGTDLELSIVGLGCWAIGGLWWGDDVTDKDSIGAIHAALERGINWFDTAPLYGYGHADEVLRKALSGRSEEAVIVTKVGVRWDGATDHAESLLTADHVRTDVEASLQRLGVERIDLLKVHWPCQSDTPLEETFGTLEALREEGKVRYLGVCNYDATQLQAVLDVCPSLVALQTGYSMIRRELEGNLCDLCLGEEASTPRLGVFAYESLARGLLTGKFKTQPHFPKSDLRARDGRFQGNRYWRIQSLVRDLRLIAERARTTPAALAIGWVARQPGVTCVIVGAKRAEQVDQNADAVALLGRKRLWDLIEQVVNAFRG